MLWLFFAFIYLLSVCAKTILFSCSVFKVLHMLTNYLSYVLHKTVSFVIFFYFTSCPNSNPNEDTCKVVFSLSLMPPGWDTDELLWAKPEGIHLHTSLLFFRSYYLGDFPRSETPCLSLLLLQQSHKKRLRKHCSSKASSALFCVTVLRRPKSVQCYYLHEKDTTEMASKVPKY